MKKLYTLFATLLFLALGFNCTKPGYINCEAFNSPLFDQWVPYKSNATTTIPLAAMQNLM